MRRGTGRAGSAPRRGSGGAWETLRSEVSGWPGVTVLRRFGRDGLSLRGRMFACGPAAGDDLWVRLTVPLQQRALRETGILPHPRFARTGWIVVRLRGASGRSLARRWLARAYAAARDVPPVTA
ncbi:MAG: luciferase family protein [Candidatus Methylomirabilales bacterium]